MKALGIEVRRVPEVAPGSAAEVWVTKDGRRMTIGEMGESHVKHALALVLRHLRAEHRPVFDDHGRLCWRQPLADLSAWQEEFEREFERDPFRGADEPEFRR